MVAAVSAAELAPREATEVAAMVLALEVMAAAAMEVDMVLLPVDMVAGTAVDMEALLLAAMAVDSEMTWVSASRAVGEADMAVAP